MAGRRRRGSLPLRSLPPAGFAPWGDACIALTRRSLSGFSSLRRVVAHVFSSSRPLVITSLFAPMPSLETAAAEICQVCVWLHARNLLAASDGNVSVRLDDGRVLMTPSGVSKARLRPEDMAIMTLDGEVERGKPSSERAMHL